MTFKDWWKSKPNWIRSGIISSGVILGYIIIVNVLQNIIYHFTSCRLTAQCVDQLSTITENFQFFVHYPTNWILNMIDPCIGLSCLRRIGQSLFVHIILILIYGFLIGLIIQKIKSKK